jgi:hypothetical protein
LDPAASDGSFHGNFRCIGVGGAAMSIFLLLCLPAVW